jgi:uncharacterized protein YqjF (DUF2071 family)
MPGNRLSSSASDNASVSDTLDSVSRQLALAEESPAGWTLAETRREVLFAHWPVAIDALARLLPPELAVDTFDGEAWLGLVACRVEAMRVRGLPPLPGLSGGPQLEACTYVTAGDRAGVWLFSLDRGKQLLAEAAKRSLRLPAYRAEISAGTGSIDVERDGLAFRARYEPAGAEFTPAPRTLDHFLTERYALYTADGGRLYRAELGHRPWSVRTARCTVGTATIAPLLLDGTPHALYAASQDILAWPLEEV